LVRYQVDQRHQGGARAPKRPNRVHRKAQRQPPSRPRTLARIVLHTFLYTSVYANMAINPHPPLTIAEWQRAYLAGAQPAQLLGAQRQRLQGRAAPVYLWIADEATLASQLAHLAMLEQRFPDDRAAMLAAHPLWGVPFVVKDNIDIAGTPTTCACPAFSRVATQDATVVARLRAAGAVWLAKTNLDQFATGLVGTRSPYGAPTSAWSARHVSGGSSSGSAVAVAQGDVPLALGTDTAGSGRIPAAFNHVVGLKPTPGRVSTAGIVPACRSLDCPSIFALTLHDATLALAVLEGADPADPFSQTVCGPATLGAALRIGVPAPLPDTVGADEAAALQAACRQLEAHGHRCTPVNFEPLFQVAALLYEGPWVVERHLVVSDLLQRQPEALDPTVRKVIGAAERHTAGGVFEARYALQALARQAHALWADVDVLMVPTAPRHPTLEDVAADPVGANAALGLFTNFVNLLGWCALSLPAAVAGTGLPKGITLLGRGGFDAALAALGQQWQALARQTLGATGKPWQAEAPLGPRPATEPSLPLAVVGAHLSGLPLNHQLTELGATLATATTTSARYRLYALPDSKPAKPGLLRVEEDGKAIAVEVWNLPLHQVGRFLAGIPAPLGLGTLELADGSRVHGFLCEPWALRQAQDISHHGGWRAYLATL
jgi:allophanate hydrolase